MTFAVLLVLGLVVAGCLAYRSYRKDEQRRQTLFAWATSSGWSYTVEDDGWCTRWGSEPFGIGDHRRAKNVLTGRWRDRDVVAFDYSYQTHQSSGRGGRTTTTHRFSVCALTLPTYLQTLQVTPENVLTRLGNAVGLADIELESEDFNRRFRVRADEPKFASDVLTPRTMELLLSRPPFSWRVQGEHILGWSPQPLTPPWCLAMATTLADVLDGIPSFVWQDHGQSGTTTVGGSA